MTIIHPDRCNPTSYETKNGVVVHDAESTDGAVATLISMMQRAGDRQQPDGSMIGASYHAITNGGGGYVQVGDANVAPFAAPPVNATFWHVCMPGRASQTREQWQDSLSRAHIRGVARFIVDKSRLDGFPLEYLSPAELVAGHHGYTSHYNVSQAWHRTDHYDPGPNFPWDILAADIAELTRPEPPTEDPPTPQEEDMLKRIRVNDDAAVFVLDGLTCIWASSRAVPALESVGLMPSAAQEVLIPRAALGAFELHGPLPDYTGVGMPGRTTSADFARHVT